MTKTYKEYVIEFQEHKLKGCMLERAFPYAIKKLGFRAVVQWAKTVKGAKAWIDKQK